MKSVSGFSESLALIEILLWERERDSWIELEKKGGGLLSFFLFVCPDGWGGGRFFFFWERGGGVEDAMHVVVCL